MMTNWQIAVILAVVLSLRFPGNTPEKFAENLKNFALAIHKILGEE